MLKNSACQDVAGGPDGGAVEIWNSFQINFSKIFSWLIHEHATITASQPFLNLIILQWMLGVAILPTTANTIST